MGGATGAQSTHGSRSRLPVFPVLLPVVLLVVYWLATPLLIMLSEGSIGVASCLALPTTTIGTVMAVVALARFRSGVTWAHWLVWAAILLCIGVDAYWIWRFERMVASATASADAASAEAIQRSLGADRLWVWIAAALSLLPVVGGGAGGYFWLRAASKRVSEAGP